MTVRTRTTAALVGVASLVVLTGCEKPTPRVLVKAGTSYASSEAAQYCRDDCKQYGRDIKTVHFSAGDVIGVDVPRALTDSGWRFAIVATPAGATQAEVQYDSGPQHDHYATYTVTSNANLSGSNAQLLVQEMNTTGDTAKGTWVFNLEGR